MGIDILAASFILNEHIYRPISGTILTIGRQTIGFTGSQLDSLLSKYKIKKIKNHKYEMDNDTLGVTKKDGNISQESFFGAFTNAKVLSLDVSDYENADIIFDLQDSVPDEYLGIADFIYNGSCLDNIFDAAAAVRNISRLLNSDGGRVYHYEQGNSHPTAYLKYSVDWFMDYFAINNFMDCKTYICDKPRIVGVPLISGYPGRPVDVGIREIAQSDYDIIVYSFNPYVELRSGPGYDCSSVELFSRYEIHCLAEKGLSSTNDRNPIQKHYRVDVEHKKACEASAQRFLHSDRPLFSNGIEFDAESIPRIDSSDYPEQMKPVAVFKPNFLNDR